MESERDERLSAEIALLESMYPDQVSFNEKSQEVSYVTNGSNLKIRLSSGYLIEALPEALSASIGRADQREAVKRAITSQPVGEEVLDSIILSFSDLVEQHSSQQAQDENQTPGDQNSSNSKNGANATIIVYLHHLLNTNKRKMCVSPADSSISGVTKPGYPGVLIYSGPSAAVHEHVNELKGLNWAAFQVRSEMEGEEWKFKHGKGVVEVESMGDVVAEVDVEEGRKETFMEAMRMK